MSLEISHCPGLTKKKRGKPMENTIIGRDTDGLRMRREEFDDP